jgi:DNA polymerase III epsilon subunit-like protein
MVLAYNAEFDVGFTRQLLNEFEFEFKTHHVLLDVSNTTFICFGTYKADHVFELFGYDKRGAHNALEDARMCLGVAKQYNSIFKELFAT